MSGTTWFGNGQENTRKNVSDKNTILTKQIPGKMSQTKNDTMMAGIRVTEKKI